MRWHLHEAEQAFAVERALQAQQAPHLPQQSVGPGWANDNTDNADNDNTRNRDYHGGGYRAYGGPIAEHSN